MNVPMYTSTPVQPFVHKKTKVGDACLAQSMLEKMFSRIDISYPVPAITQAEVYIDGNLTVAIINGELGWSKFNPNDFLEIKTNGKYGKVCSSIKSKHSQDAGKKKAIHRAVRKIFLKEIKRKDNQ